MKGLTMVARVVRATVLGIHCLGTCGSGCQGQEQGDAPKGPHRQGLGLHFGTPDGDHPAEGGYGAALAWLLCSSCLSRDLSGSLWVTDFGSGPPALRPRGEMLWPSGSHPLLRTVPAQKPAGVESISQLKSWRSQESSHRSG